MATATFLFVVFPSFAWVRRNRRIVPWPSGFLGGLFLGSLVMLLFMTLSDWPVGPAELVGGGVAGAVGGSIYARLTFKGGAEPDAAPNGDPATRLGNSGVTDGPP